MLLNPRKRPSRSSCLVVAATMKQSPIGTTMTRAYRVFRYRPRNPAPRKASFNPARPPPQPPQPQSLQCYIVPSAPVTNPQQATAAITAASSSSSAPSIQQAIPSSAANVAAQATSNPQVSVGTRSSVEVMSWLTSMVKQGARGVPPPPSSDSPTLQLIHPRSTRGRKIVGGIILASGIYVGLNLEKAPYTNRIRLLAIPLSVELFLAKNFLSETFPENKVRRDDDSTTATDSLVQILVETAENNFLGPIRPKHAMETFPWNVTVIDNPNVNAFCAPGGSVVVFSGLIDFCVEAERQKKVESASAAVCGVVAHEISHGILRHGMETLSWMPPLMIVMVLSQAFFVSMGFGPEEVRLLNSVFQEIVQFFLRLPHSRKVESEADLLGSELLLKAGLPVDDYPRVLSLLESGGAEWFSTHPAPEKRAQVILDHLQKQEIRRREDDKAVIEGKQVSDRLEQILEDARKSYWRFSRRPDRQHKVYIGRTMSAGASWRPKLAN